MVGQLVQWMHLREILIIYLKKNTETKKIYTNRFLMTIIYEKVFLFVDTKFRGFYKYIDLWGLEYVVSNITSNHQWEYCISLDFNFRSLSESSNQLRLEPHD